jgi:hypothetical protein
MASLEGGGIDDPKKKKKSKPYDFDAELKGAYKNKLKYDGDRTAKEVVLSAAKKANTDANLLLASAWQEGMNKAVLDPDSVSEAYGNAIKKDPDLQNYPVDGFWNYGVDTFGNNYQKLKKYLPEGFDQKYKLYNAVNEKNQPIQTAAFKTNEDALIAKSAFLNLEKDNVGTYANTHGVELDDKAKNYFTLASYNTGFGNAKKMIDEYAQAKDKNAYIDKGLTKYKEVHKNISPRLKRMQLASEMLADPAPTGNSTVDTFNKVQAEGL